MKVTRLLIPSGLSKLQPGHVSEFGIYLYLFSEPVQMDCGPVVLRPVVLKALVYSSFEYECMRKLCMWPCSHTPLRQYGCLKAMSTRRQVFNKKFCDSIC